MQVGRQRRELPSVRYSSTHRLACCLGRLLTVIAISNPAGALCTLERRVAASLFLFRLSFSSSFVPFLLSALTAPEHVNQANDDQRTFDEVQEDDCNGHLLGKKRPNGLPRSDWITRRRCFSPSRGQPDIEIPNLFRVITWKDTGYAFRQRNVAHARGRRRRRRGEKLAASQTPVCIM